MDRTAGWDSSSLINGGNAAAPRRNTRWGAMGAALDLRGGVLVAGVGEHGAGVDAGDTPEDRKQYYIAILREL